MMLRTRSARNIPALSLALFTTLGGGLYAQSPATVIQGARVFTGDEVLDTATVVIRGRTIESVTPGANIPATAGAEAEVVEAQGMTLLPGLIDSHTHNFGPSLEQALNFGVTTVLDMATDANMARQWRRQQAEGRATERADVFAGGPVTVKGGHGTQFGMSLPTLDDPEQTEAFIAERVAEGSDFIKVIYEGGGTVGRAIPTFAPSTLPRIVAAAHSHGQLAVFHISTVAEAFEAIRAGADGLVHVYHDQKGTAEVVEAARSARIFVIPTLAVSETLAGSSGGPDFAGDPQIAPFLTPDQRGGLGQGFGREPDPEMRANLISSVAALYSSGIPILAGSDAPNPGTTHGASVHRELELLVEAGLTPIDALRAATSAPANAFGLDDRGRTQGRPDPGPGRCDLRCPRRPRSGDDLERRRARRAPAGRRADRQAPDRSHAAQRLRGSRRKRSSRQRLGSIHGRSGRRQVDGRDDDHEPRRGRQRAPDRGRDQGGFPLPMVRNHGPARFPV